MITASQIRQARAALNIGQQEIADACGIHKTTLSDIENEKSAGSQKAFAALQNFFEGQGLEFTENDGVRKNKKGLKPYKGTAEFRMFYDDIYETAKKQGGDLCLYNGMPSYLIKWLGEDFYKMHASRMTQIKDKFDFRVIIREEDRQMIGAGFARYRWFPSELFKDKTIYVYGEKVAFVDFSNDNVRAMVIEQKEIAESQRILFNIAWEHVAQEVAA